MTTVLTFNISFCQVQTKTVSQCVEFYYNSKRLLEKQKPTEREKGYPGEETNSVTVCQVTL